MSVTQSVIRHRRVASVACTALLTAGIAGCSDLGRTAVGPVDRVGPLGRVVQVDSPVVTGCHRFALPGARTVSNGTLIDMVVYPTFDCSGKDSAYIATTLSDTIAPGHRPWRSYRFIH